MSAPAYSCRKAAELLSKRLDEPLGPHERFQLGFHLFLCRSCRHAKHQFEEIRSLTSGLLSGALEGDDGGPGGEERPAPGPGRA